jgi:hypothetical protein
MYLNMARRISGGRVRRDGLPVIGRFTVEVLLVGLLSLSVLRESEPWDGLSNRLVEPALDTGRANSTSRAGRLRSLLTNLRMACWKSEVQLAASRPEN